MAKNSQPDKSSEAKGKENSDIDQLLKDARNDVPSYSQWVEDYANGGQDG